MDVLPNCGEKRGFSKACTAARTLATGPVAMAQRKSVVDDLGNAANALLDISMCSGSIAAELGAMSHWLQCFHKRAEHFCHVYTHVDEGGTMVRRALRSRGHALPIGHMQWPAIWPPGRGGHERVQDFHMDAEQRRCQQTWLNGPGTLLYAQKKSWRKAELRHSKTRQQMKEKNTKSIVRHLPNLLRRLLKLRWCKFLRPILRRRKITLTRKLRMRMK